MPIRKIIGTHAINEFIKTRPRTISKALFREDYKKFSDLKDLHSEISKYTKAIDFMGMKKLDREASGHQGCILFSQDLPELDWQSLESTNQALVLILDGIQDPNNLGAILRTAWLMGVKVIFSPTNRASGLSPAVHKVASGGVEHVPVEFVPQVAEPMKKLKDMGFWIYGLAESGEGELYTSELHEKSAIVIGSEESGMKRPTEKVCDQILKIPQIKGASSYNASVSAALALAEYRRAHPFS